MEPPHPAAPQVLSVADLRRTFHDRVAVDGITFEVGRNEIVGLLGPNGAGKTTTINMILGVLEPTAGTIRIEGADIASSRDRALGQTNFAAVHAPMPGNLTVRQNLLLGAYNPDARRDRVRSLAEVEALFPVLTARGSQLAYTLSGGEQQMVAIARGLMARPSLLMIDEPFLGLAPRIVEQISEAITALNRERGLTIVFIEQNVELALSLADRGYVLESGRTVLSGPSATLLQSSEVKRIFLGDF